ncbi:5894_t:CDS:2, partial [Dentiscutata erythropus]
MHLIGEEYETIATRRPRRAATQSVSYQTKPARAIRTTRSSTRKRSQPATSPPPSPPSPPSPVEISVKKVDAPDKETKQEPYSMEIDESKQEQSHPTRIRLRLHSPERSTSPVSEKPIKRKRKAGRPRKNESSHRITLSTGNHKKVKGLSHSIEDADEADNEMDDRLQKNNDDDQSTIKNEEVTSKEDKSKEGNNMKLDVDSEENEIIDEKGEQKITKDGELLGGRKYKVPVFQLESRESTLYMCSMEPAKCLGFRDSYLFFSKNPSLKRISATDEEREWLVANGYLPSNFRNRAITIVRSNYMPNPRALISETNWMYHVALSCRDFNNRLNIHRSEKTKFYDPHTNNEQIPRDTQPTRIQVEMVSSPHFYIRKGQTTTIEPELQFKPRFINPLGKLTTGVTEVLPPDIKEIVENMKKNEEAAECKIEN